MFEPTDSIRHAVMSVGRDMLRQEWGGTACRWAVVVGKEEPTVSISDLMCQHLTCGSLFYIYIYIYIYTVIPRLTSDPANEFFG